MPQPFRDDLGWYPCLERGRGIGVTEILRRPEIEVLCSVESLAEIGQMEAENAKRLLLEDCYHRLKDGEPVIRNCGVGWDDQITGWASHDVGWDHTYDNTDLDQVGTFLASVGNRDDMDARDIANAMLPENAIDVFVTFDARCSRPPPGEPHRTGDRPCRRGSR